MVAVVVHHPDRAPSGRLLGALRAKHVEIETCSDRFGAFAAYCRAAREPGTSLSILLLVEPDEIEDAGELARLSTRYAPAGSVWLFTAEPTEQVREVRGSDIHAWSGGKQPDDDGGGTESRFRGAQHEGTEDALRAAPRESRQPALRLAPETRNPAAETDTTDAGDPDEPGGSDPLLTDEELAMLLADDPLGDPPPERHGDPRSEDR